MNCHEFEFHLERLLDRQLDLAKRQACFEHAAKCATCGELLTAVGDAPTATEAPANPPLIESVLERTIGSACGQAKEKLPAFVDQELTIDDKNLVALHLSTCPDCSRLAATLSMLVRELPRLAEAPVDEQFTHQVLAATLQPHIRVQRWWRTHWSAWVRRPRFAMEAAYVGFLFLMLVMGSFSTPVAALPQKGLELMQTDSESPTVWTQANDGLGTFWEAVASLFEKAESEQEPSEESP